jgi:hypothetical protein
MVRMVAKPMGVSLLIDINKAVYSSVYEAQLVGKEGVSSPANWRSPDGQGVCL